MTDGIEMIDPVTGAIVNEQQLAEQLLKRAKEQCVARLVLVLAMTTSM